MLNFCDFIQVFVFTTNHHLNELSKYIFNHNFFYFFYVGGGGEDMCIM